MKNIRWQMLVAVWLAIGAAIPASGARRFVITSFGAVGDGKTSNTPAIQSLIDRVAKEGGGTVVVPDGTFLTGALFFKQGVNLFIEKNGTLKGSVEQSDYPQVKTRWEGIEREWTSALLNFTDMNGVDVSGDGTVDGSGDLWLQRSGFGRGRGAPPQGPRLGRPRMICFQNCKRVRISRLRLRREAVWCLHILYSQDVTVDGIEIRCDHNIPSADGIDIDSSRKVRVRNVDIDNNDDSITIKSGKDEDGLRVNRPSEDIIIENSRFHHGGSVVAMGSETSGGIRNVTIRHCVADSDNSAPIRFKTQPSRGGVVENITYSDIQLNGTRQAFEFNMEWRMVPPIAPPAKVLPIVRNVTIRNVRGTVRTVGVMHGLAGSPIRNVKFEKCDITADKGLVIENARNVDLSGLKLTVKNGDAITKKNVE
ncbi:MAG: glycoside hydrolase family 28 protein [Bryobacteraceae bacterium]|jgi:polygalacturonase